MCVCVTGNGEDHRRAERDLGGEAEEDGVHPPGEVTLPGCLPPPIYHHPFGYMLISIAPSLTCRVCLSSREAILAEMGVSIKEDGGTLGVFSPKGVSLTAAVSQPDKRLSDSDR